LKTTLKIFLIAVILGAFLAGSSMAKQRKLPVGAYIKTAKIHILSGEPDRYDQAIIMLDSLFLNYGPIAEGLFWMSQIYVDYINKTPGLVGKIDFVEKMVAYNDSLKICCDKDNKEIEKKYKKDCKEFIEKTDSTSVMFWRQFYNDGIEQLNEVKLVLSDINNETDSATLAFLNEKLQTRIDSCRNNIDLAIIIDSANFQPYMVLATLDEQLKDYEASNKSLIKALEFAKEDDERKPMLIQVAYNYINMNKFCDAIPPFREYLELAPEDVPNARNLTICYNNCEMFDSAYALNMRLLAKSPEDTDVLTSIGRYWNQRGRFASDSANYFRSQKNEDSAKIWQGESERFFDSARVYFKKVFELNPDDDFAAEEYAIVAAILGNYEEAVVPFKRLTELKPMESDYWTYLGDCYLNMRKFAEAAEAYEKVAELEPENTDVLERLSDLYKEINKPKKLKVVEDKLKALKG
jgi:tetratricopeptide (TPR) repeat protein